MGVHLTVRYIRSEDNSLADALSRGSPFDDLELLPAAWRSLERRHGPHTVDCYATAATARVARFYSLLPEPRSALEPPRWPRTGVASTPSCSRPRASCRAWLSCFTSSRR